MDGNRFYGRSLLKKNLLEQNKNSSMTAQGFLLKLQSIIKIYMVWIINMLLKLLNYIWQSLIIEKKNYDY